MFLSNPKWDAIRTRSRLFDVAKTFPNKPLRNLMYFDFAPYNHIYWCSVIQVRTKFMKVIIQLVGKGVIYYNRVGVGAMLFVVFYGFLPSTFSARAARCGLFSQISSAIRLLIVANCSLLLQLSLDFFFSSVFTRQLIHAGSLEDIVTVLRGTHVSIKVMSFA